MPEIFNSQYLKSFREEVDDIVYATKQTYLPIAQTILHHTKRCGTSLELDDIVQGLAQQFGASSHACRRAIFNGRDLGLSLDSQATFLKFNRFIRSLSQILTQENKPSPQKDQRNIIRDFVEQLKQASKTSMLA